MKHIYISPHSDDVALSCGGQIIANPARSENVLVLNMFTSERPEGGEAQGALALFDSVNAERTREDEAAWKSIGVECVYANLPEALLRRQFPFRLGRERGGAIVDSVCDVVAEQARSHPGALFHFPAGFGSHVDHLACKAAAFRLLDEGKLDRLLLYEDVPYSWLRFIRRRYYRELLGRARLDDSSRELAFRRDGEGLVDYLKGKAVPFPRGKKLFPLVYASLALRRQPSGKRYSGKVKAVRLTDEQLAAKKQLLLHYHSQIPMLFGDDPDALLARLHEAATKEVTIEVRRA